MTAVDRWNAFGTPQILGAVGRLAPSVAHHAALRPYRRALQLDPYSGTLGRMGRRIYCGLFDATVSLLMQGYTELTGHRLSAIDGSVGLMFIRVLSAVDDEIDRRIVSGEPLELDDVLNGPIVKVRLRTWHDLASGFHGYDAVMEEYWALGRLHFDEYVNNLGRSEFGCNAQSVMESIRLDSGDQLRWLVRTWSTFNDYPVYDRALREFFAVGVAGKLADDLCDVAIDMRSSSVNILQALAHPHPVEATRVANAVAATERMDLSWWITQAPRTFDEFSELFFAQVDDVSSPSLRRACYLMVLPVMRGLARSSRR